MSKAKYAVRNGDNHVGILWENEKLGKVFVVQSEIDINFDLEIMDIDTGNIVDHVDLREFIFDALPFKQDK
jgi:hypothetical protein